MCGEVFLNVAYALIGVVIALTIIARVKVDFGYGEVHDDE